MRTVLGLAILIALGVPTAGRADTVYLRDGQSVWGTEVYEERDTVVVVRPSGKATFPKARVERIERVQRSLPAYYSAPAEPPPPTSAPAVVPVAKPASPPATGAPPASSTADTGKPAAPAAAPSTAPAPSTPTALPSPGPPPVR